MHYSLQHIVIKAFIALMAVLVINVSIDAFDFQPLDTNSELCIDDFNYLNSFAEYFTEVVLGHKDAFPEFQKEASSSKSQFVKHIDVKIYPKDSYCCLPVYKTIRTEFLVPLKENYHFLYFNEINPPPPKV